MKTKRDDGLEWLREIRRDLAGRFDHDPKKIGAYYKQLEKKHASRLYKQRASLCPK
jgi:hypothetical protein